MSNAQVVEAARESLAFESDERHKGEEAGRFDATIRVFIADDQPFFRRGLRTIIDKEPDLEVCGEVWERDQLARESRRTRPDVIVMELYLQDREAINLIKQVRATLPATQIVVLSRHDELVYAVPAFKAGARAFVMKQDEPRAVIAAIREVHRGKPCFSWEVNSLLLSRISAPRSHGREVGTVSLSPRELEVVTLIAAGYSSREIATRLKVSIKTVEAHRAHIKQKANVDNSAALIRFSMAVANDQSLIAV